MLSMSFSYENAMKDLKLLIGLSFNASYLNLKSHLKVYTESLKGNVLISLNASYLNLKSPLKVYTESYKCQV